MKNNDARGAGMNTMAKLGLFGNAVGRTDVWATPQNLFNKLNAVFNFDLDVCALAEYKKFAALMPVIEEMEKVAL